MTEEMQLGQAQPTPSESGMIGLKHAETNAGNWKEDFGLWIPGFLAASIVVLKDGTYLTEKGQVSKDKGRTWSERKALTDDDPRSGEDLVPLGLVRLADGALGYYYGTNWTMESTCGNGEEAGLFIRRSTDEGKSWGEEMRIHREGSNYALEGTMFVLSSGRVILVAYSHFLARQGLWGKSVGLYKGIPLVTETEGHFGKMEAVRVYFSDDHGCTWKPNDGYIVGFSSEHNKTSTYYVEAVGVELNNSKLLLYGRTLTGRVFRTISEDQGYTFSSAVPTSLMSSDSPGFLGKLPNGNLLYVWNQVSREEIRRGFRRSRLTSALSRDGGDTWSDFKIINSISCLADRALIPPDPEMSPITGDDDVGKLPDDFAAWYYPTINSVNDEIFLSYITFRCELDSDRDEPAVREIIGSETLILPVTWFSTPSL